MTGFQQKFRLRMVPPQELGLRMHVPLVSSRVPKCVMETCNFLACWNLGRPHSSCNSYAAPLPRSIKDTKRANAVRTERLAAIAGPWLVSKTMSYKAGMDTSDQVQCPCWLMPRQRQPSTAVWVVLPLWIFESAPRCYPAGQTSNYETQVWSTQSWEYKSLLFLYLLCLFEFDLMNETNLFNLFSIAYFQYSDNFKICTFQEKSGNYIFQANIFFNLLHLINPLQYLQKQISSELLHQLVQPILHKQRQRFQNMLHQQRRVVPRHQDAQNTKRPLSGHNTTPNPAHRTF